MKKVGFIFGIFGRFKSREWGYHAHSGDTVGTVTGAGFQMVYSIEECSLEICSKGKIRFLSVLFCLFTSK